MGVAAPTLRTAGTDARSRARYTLGNASTARTRMRESLSQCQANFRHNILDN
jgi:hypothetical protein